MLLSRKTVSLAVVHVSPGRRAGPHGGGLELVGSSTQLLGYKSIIRAPVSAHSQLSSSFLARTQAVPSVPGPLYPHMAGSEPHPGRLEQAELLAPRHVLPAECARWRDEATALRRKW